MRPRINFFTKKWIALEFWILVAVPMTAQTRVELNTFSERLYLGYVNEMRISIVSPKNGAAADGFLIHAKAEGASIDYNEKGELKVLPSKNGYISFFLEKNGIYYAVNDSLHFEAMKAPSLENIDFVKAMGITKTDSKTKLKNVKHFNPPSKIQKSDFELNGRDLAYGYLEPNKKTKVRLRILIKRKINGEEYFVRQNSDKYESEIHSNELKIEKVASNLYYITLLPDKKKATIAISLNGELVDKKTVTAYEH
jgi:hypothetical protein